MDDDALKHEMIRKLRPGLTPIINEICDTMGLQGKKRQVTFDMLRGFAEMMYKLGVDQGFEMLRRR